MKRVIVPIVIAVALVTSACGAGGGATRARRTVMSSLDRISSDSYSFVYKETLADTKTEIVVTGSVADDLRQQATLQVDGHELLQHIVSDDAIAVRVLDEKRALPYIAQVSVQDRSAGLALAAGKWIVDHQGAPDLLAPRTGENAIRVGANPMLDATNYLFQYFEDSMNDSRGMEEWNPDAADYNPLDDPWKEDAEANLVDQGIRRYSIVQPPLPSRTARGSEGALTDTQHFRKMAFYLRGSDIMTAKEQIKIDDRVEFRRSRAGRAADYFQVLLAQALAGATREPVRQRNMEITFERADVSIQLPSDDFVGVPSLDLVSGVASLVPQVDAGSRFGPGSPAARTSPVPASTDEPEGTGSPAPTETADAP